MEITVKWLTEWTRDLLAPVLAGTWRYFKTFYHFRQPFDGGVSYLAIDAGTHGRGTYYLAFHVGVRHDRLEVSIRQLLGQEPRLSHYDRSIRCYTVNVGPKPSGAVFPIWGSWSFATTSDAEAAAGDIRTFTSGFTIPYVRRHEDLATVRRTLVDEPWLAQNLEPYRQILMVDRLAGDEQQARRDLELLSERYAAYRGRPLQEWEDFRSRFKGSRGA